MERGIREIQRTVYGTLILCLVYIALNVRLCRALPLKRGVFNPLELEQTRGLSLPVWHPHAILAQSVLFAGTQTLQVLHSLGFILSDPQEVL